MCDECLPDERIPQICEHCYGVVDLSADPLGYAMSRTWPGSYGLPVFFHKTCHIQSHRRTRWPGPQQQRRGHSATRLKPVTCSDRWLVILRWAAVCTLLGCTVRSRPEGIEASHSERMKADCRVLANVKKTLTV
jgi:hypothetical protein